MIRIISVRPAPVGRVFAVIYAVAGLGGFVVFAFSSLQTFTLPIGLLMGFFHLNLNLQLARSPDLIANAFLCLAVILSYALSGWITGVALTLCFNLIAKKTGGLDAEFVSVDSNDSAMQSLA
jgi:hypothetical protein